MKAPEFREGCVIPGTQYEIVATLGSGTLGSVYDVVHRELGKRFVLKAVDALRMDRGELVPRLREQWRTLAELEHPSFVAVTDAGSTEAGIPFLVMEWLEGETLATRLGRAATLSTAEALEVALGVLSGLEAAHGIGIVHGAIKPSNVFLVGATVKILDCGLGPIAAALRAPAGLGTCRYSAPELAAGGPIDARSDLFSLGVVLFEMLTGADPFRAAGDRSDQTGIGASRLGRAAVRLRAVFPSADPALEAVLDRLLEREARCRPENAHAVRTVVARLVERYHAGIGCELTAQVSEVTDQDALGGDTIVDGPPSAADARCRAGEPSSEAATAMAPARASTVVDSTPAPAGTSSRGWSAGSPATGPDATVPLTGPVTEISASMDEPGPTRTAAAVRLPVENPPPNAGSESSLSSRPIAQTPRSAKWLMACAVAAIALVALVTVWRSRTPARKTASGPSSKQHAAAVPSAPPAPSAIAPSSAAVQSAAAAPALQRAHASGNSGEPGPTPAQPPVTVTSKRRRTRPPRMDPRVPTARPSKRADASGGSSSSASPTVQPPPVLPGSGL
ncbi:MAG: serine/threonine protein kinase [Polyangiaceae bacterium]|nr:serine/threonine protein kinase [Polyangiaceae bacterium]